MGVALVSIQDVGFLIAIIVVVGILPRAILGIAWAPGVRTSVHGLIPSTSYARQGVSVVEPDQDRSWHQVEGGYVRWPHDREVPSVECCDSGGAQALGGRND